MGKWLRRLKAIPEVLVSYSLLRMEVHEALGDPLVRSALDRFRSDPVIAAIYPRITSGWRTLEKALNQLR
jgi:hypothetical protein